MKWGSRIALIKEAPFLDSLQLLFPEIDVPDRPEMVSCLLPDHEDRTPSCWVRYDRWWCFGCAKGGDLLDFVQHAKDLEVKPAVEWTERTLGIGITSDGSDDELQRLISLAATERAQGAGCERKWEEGCLHIEGAFMECMRPFLRCCDPIVFSIADSRARLVFTELERVWDSPPATERGVRQGIRELARWALEWARGIERDVVRVTGKDALTCRTQPRV